MVANCYLFSMLVMFGLLISTSLVSASCTDIGFDITCQDKQGQDVGHICTRACEGWIFFGPHCKPCHASIFSKHSVFTGECQRRFSDATGWLPSAIGTNFVANQRHHSYDSSSPYVVCKNFS